MTGIQNFAFSEQLVRVIEHKGEPWFVGKDVCACLEIRNHNDAMGDLDDDEKGVATTDPLGPGGPQSVVIVSEPGVYRLVFRSRKPAAERFKRWLAHDVLPQLRKTGKFDPSPAPQLDASLLHRLQLIREARALFGRERARILWGQLDLPEVAPAPPSARDEARACLSHLLDADAGTEDSVRWLIEQALDDDGEARLTLTAAGIRIITEHGQDGFAIANRHPRLDAVFADTPWSNGAWMRVLRRLPGTATLGPTRFDGWQRRCTFVPADLLDDARLSRREYAS